MMGGCWTVSSGCGWRGGGGMGGGWCGWCPAPVVTASMVSSCGWFGWPGRFAFAMVFAFVMGGVGAGGG